MPASAVCDQCGQACVRDSITPGYGVTDDGFRLCFRCCGVVDRDSTGRAMLYLVETDRVERRGCGSVPVWEVTNWPGSLRFRTGTPKAGRHNIAGTRQDVWFRGPEGSFWHGTQYGDYSDICHCQRVQ